MGTVEMVEGAYRLFEDIELGHTEWQVEGLNHVGIDISAEY